MDKLDAPDIVDGTTREVKSLSSNIQNLRFMRQSENNASRLPDDVSLSLGDQWCVVGYEDQVIQALKEVKRCQAKLEVAKVQLKGRFSFNGMNPRYEKNA